MVQIINPQAFNTGPSDFLSGGKVYSYVGGTSTAKATYQTVEDARKGIRPNTNPVILDSKGRAKIVLNGPTKLVLKDASDNTIWTVDDIDTTSSDFNDANGNEVLVFNAAANAVNYFTLSNAITGSTPGFRAAGNDANIDVHLNTKGTGDTIVSSGGIELENGDLNVPVGDVTLTSGDMTLTSGNLTVDTLEGLDISDFPLVIAGCISWFAGSSVPTGYLECDGSAVSRTTYADLFAAIGTTYGVGDGSTTFNLPNQARNTLVGRGGTGTSTLGNSVGDTGGTETHTLTESEIPAHTHTYDHMQNLANASIFSTNPFGSDDVLGANNQVGATSASVGGGGSHNIVQPSLVMMMIIRT